MKQYSRNSSQEEEKIQMNEIKDKDKDKAPDLPRRGRKPKNFFSSSDNVFCENNGCKNIKAKDRNICGSCKSSAQRIKKKEKFEFLESENKKMSYAYRNLLDLFLKNGGVDISKIYLNSNSEGCKKSPQTKPRFKRCKTI